MRLKMVPEGLHLTSAQYGWIAGVTALLAGIAIAILARQVEPARFRRLHGPIVVAAAVFWTGYGLLLFALTWEAFYARFLPDPANRSLGRSVVGLLIYPPIGLVLWWLASRLPGNPAITFCLLGGLEALPEHWWGIYRLGMLERVPFLRDVSPASVLAFAVPEYALYWASVLGIALVLRAAWTRIGIRGGSRSASGADHPTSV
jgi:hypothetical protein